MNIKITPIDKSHPIQMRFLAYGLIFLQLVCPSISTAHDVAIALDNNLRRMKLQGMTYSRLGEGLKFHRRFRLASIPASKRYYQTIEYRKVGR